MVARGLDPRKFVHVPNGVPIAHAQAMSDGDLPSTVECRVEDERRAGRFLIGYAGGLSMSMAVETLVEAAHILATRGVSFVVVGDGTQSANLQVQVARLKLDNFHLLGRIPKSSLPKFLSAMDVLAIPGHISPPHRSPRSPTHILNT